MKQNYLVTYYKDTVKYLRDFDVYANSTFIINFATRVLSELPSSVTHMTRSIHQQIVKEDFIDLLLERLRVSFKRRYEQKQVVYLAHR